MQHTKARPARHRAFGLFALRIGFQAGVAAPVDAVQALIQRRMGLVQLRQARRRVPSAVIFCSTAYSASGLKPERAR